jgi:hypothetical protein
VDLVGTPAGKEMLKTYLDSEPYPHFEPHPTQAGLLVRIEENGGRTVGRFVNRAFVPMAIENELHTQSSVRPQSSTESTAA